MVTVHLNVATDSRTDGAARQVATFTVLSLGIAALGAGIAIAAPAAGGIVPFLLALGPALVAIVMAWREGSLGRLGATLARRPTDRRWYGALALPVIASLAVVPVAMALGQPTTGILGSLTPAAVIIPLVVLVPAFAEELAWRGFALDGLLRTMSPLAAALAIAVPWTAMHLVLYLPGQPYAGSALWPSIISVASLAVLTAWIYVGSGGSVLMAGLFHWLSNASTPLTWSVEPDVAWAVRAVIVAVLAIGVVALGGLRLPSRERVDG